MSALRTMVVEDEEPARMLLRELLRAVDDVEIIAECSSGAIALSQIRTLKPTLLLLDVELPEIDGFGVLEALRPTERPPAIVMTTAYDQYAVRAFDVCAIDYLLKPYTAQRLQIAIERVRERLSTPSDEPCIERLLLELRNGRQPMRDRLTVRSRDGAQFVDIDTIDWLQGNANYTLLHLGRVEVRIRETLSEMERRLVPHGFMRIHRSIIVNADRIFRLEPWGNGEYLVVLRDGTKVQSSRAYTENLRRLLKA